MLLYRSGLFGPLRSPGRVVLGLEERFFGTWSWFLFCGREGKGETGADGPVPEKRRQVKKGKMVTEVCSMSVVVYLSHTAVCLMKRSSSRLPCGSELESLNLSVASSTWLHTAAPDFTS